MKYTVDFEGWVTIEADSYEKAEEIFWNWVGNTQDNTLVDWPEAISECPHFQFDGAEKE